MPKPPATMTKTQYYRTCDKLRTAYIALEAVLAAAEFAGQERIGAAMGALTRVPNALRVQVCARCEYHGHYTTAEDPYTSHGCEHPDVPEMDITQPLR